MHAPRDNAGYFMESLRNIKAGMEAHGLRRIVTTGDTVSFTRVDGDNPGLAFRWGIDPMMRVMYRFFNVLTAEAKEGSAFVYNSGLDWTCLRAPRIADGPAQGYRVGLLGEIPAQMITRADYGQLVADAVTDDALVGKSVTCESYTAKE